LGALEFLCRPAVREGEVSEEVISFSIRTAISDPETGELQFPDPDQDAARISQVQHRLAARSGIPVTTILKEQEARLTTGTPQKPRKTQPAAMPAPVASDATPATPAEESLPPVPATSRRIEDAARPVPHSTKKTQSLPTLDEQQKSFLIFISEHPDTPLSALYKALGVSVWKGNEIRDNLKAKGFLTEVELRTGKAGAGRPAKFVLLTFQAFQLFALTRQQAGAVWFIGISNRLFEMAQQPKDTLHSVKKSWKMAQLWMSIWRNPGKQ
jgi:hypothetical protein